VWNGCQNFLHPHGTLTFDAFCYILGYLLHVFPFIKQFSSLSSDKEVEDIIAKHAQKSAGDPFIEQGYPEKLVALKYFGLAGLRKIYGQYMSVIAQTLKDEIRDITKDARLFRPQDVGSYQEGATLFNHQNEYLMSRPLDTPIFLKFSTPGPMISQLFQSLWGLIYAADGRKWDAHFPLVFAMIIAVFRSTDENRERVFDYYARMYNGYTSVRGWLMRLAGNPSGHFNTSVDNCLGHMCFFAYHSYKHKLTYAQVDDVVEYHCCGDDLLWCTESEIFSPKNIENTYNEMEMYLEFESYEPSPIYDLSFVGSTPVDYQYYCRKLLLYHGRPNKLSAKFKIRRIKAQPIDTLSKMVSICTLMFAHPLYEQMKKLIFQYIEHNCSLSLLSWLDPRVIGLVAAIEKNSLLVQYTRWE